MQIKKIAGGVTAPDGFLASGIHCGIRKNKQKRDLALIYSEVPCTAAAVHTQNLVCGAPNTVTRRHLENHVAQAIICNSGNANTCNADGEQKAEMMAKLIARRLSLKPEDVVVASTGVIGQVLPIEPIENGADQLVAELSRSGSTHAAEAIVTTDTVIKETACEFTLGGKTCRMGGIAKGSGMIHPNMATMLSFLTTDAAISGEMIHKALTRVIADTFNMVSVDGDTSTNDMVALLASGLAGNPEITAEGEDYEVFCKALHTLCSEICRRIAKDGEGATKLLVCHVKGAKTVTDAKKAAKSVICSSLLKAAMFGSDANWGRVLCALGYSGADIDVHTVAVRFVSRAGEVAVCKNGAGIDFSEELAKAVLSEDEILIDISVQGGSAEAEAYGCDLTYDYVKINGDYRT